MIIRSIKFNNFAVYKGQQQIQLCNDVSGQKTPITLVGGLNGRGKTTILDAVLLNLYGKRSPRIPRGESYSDYLTGLISNTVDDLFQEESWVELILEIPTSSGYTTLRIKRLWQVRQVRATDRLLVWQDGRPNEHLAETWDAYIEEQIPSAIAELFFFDGERISALAESEDTLESLQRAIRSLLGVEAVDRLIRNLGLLIRRKQKDMQNSELYRDFKETQEQLESLEQQLVRLRQDQAGIKTRLAQVERDREALDAQYLAVGGGIFEDRSTYIELRATLSNRLNDLRASMVAAASGVLPLALLPNSIEAITDMVRNEEDVKKARYIVSEIESLRDNLYHALINQEEGVRALVQETIGDRHRELLTLSQQDIRYDITLAHTQQVSDLIPTEITRVSQLHEEFSAVQNELEQVEASLSFDLDPEQFEELIEQRTKTHLLVAELQKSWKDFETEKLGLQTEINRLEAFIVRFGNQIAETEEAERIVKYAVETQEKMREFRNRLMERKVGDFAASITNQFIVLTHKESLVERILVDPLSLKITLKDSNSQIIQKSRLSAGERQMLAIAILWGLAKASGRSIPVIIDTPMGRLDSLHRMNFAGKYLPNASHQVLVLSTDTEIEGDYLRAIDSYVGQRYMLEYLESEKRTRIREGYFEKTQGEVAATI